MPLVCSSSFTEPMQQQFLAEALLMAQFHHEHILPLIGVCLDPHPDGPYMLLEYMDKGDLSNYLKSMRNASPVGLYMISIIYLQSDSLL